MTDVEDPQRPNVVIDGECAEETEYAGMDISFNLKQKSIWTGFDLIQYTNAEEFLDGILHMLQFAAPNLTLKEEDDD